jgi:nitrogen regulatory protein P-II 1
VKRIDAIVRPNSLDEIRNRLIEIGVQGMTVSEVRGFGRQKGHTEVYRGTEYAVNFVPKVMVTVITADEIASNAVDAIINGARTGKMGDGKIFITPIEEVIRIRTSDRGEAAL